MKYHPKRLQYQMDGQNPALCHRCVPVHHSYGATGQRDGNRCQRSYRKVPGAQYYRIYDPYTKRGGHQDERDAEGAAVFNYAPAGLKRRQQSHQQGQRRKPTQVDAGIIRDIVESCKGASDQEKGKVFPQWMTVQQEEQERISCGHQAISHTLSLFHDFKQFAREKAKI